MKCPHRINTALQHCWECEPKAPVESTKRNSGRTSRMLEALPVENTPTVVVHTQDMAEYVRKLAQHLRPDLRHPIRVRIVRDARDCNYLRGVRFVVDHATLERAKPEVRQMFAVLSRKPE